MRISDWSSDVCSSDLICRAVEEAFTAHRIDAPPRAAIRRIVGLSLVEAMRMLLPEAQADDHARLADTYKQVFFAMRTTGGPADEPLFDGLADLLGTPDAAGWRTGVPTAKSDRRLRHILAAPTGSAACREKGCQT